MKVKAQRLQYEMRKIKGEIEEANSRHEDLSRGSDCHKGAPTSTLLKHSRRVSLSGNQVSSVNTITVTLIPIFTKGDCPRRRGLRPPHKVVDVVPHQAGGSLSCKRATNAPRRPAHRSTSLVHSRTSHKDHNLVCSLTQELI